MRRGLCESLMEIMGVDAKEPEIPEGAETPRTHLYELLNERLTKLHAPHTEDPFESFQLSATASLSRSLILADRLGSEFDVMDLDDMGKVLGKRPGNRTEGIYEISRLVKHDPEGYAGKLLPLFYRMQFRHELICEPIITGADVACRVPLGRLKAN